MFNYDKRPQIALALRARAILLVFKNFTRAYLFQIALEIMWLPIQRESIQCKDVTNHTDNCLHCLAGLWTFLRLKDVVLIINDLEFDENSSCYWW